MPRLIDSNRLVRSPRLGQILLTAPYALLGVIWIALSDRTLFWLVRDPGTMTELQTVKGWLYVMGSSLLLGALIQRASRCITLAERERREAKRRMNTLLGNVTGFSYRCRYDAGRRLEAIEGDVERTVGLPARAFLGDDAAALDALIHPADRRAVTTELAAAVAEGRPYMLRYRVVLPGGEQRWLGEQGVVVPSHSEDRGEEPTSSAETTPRLEGHVRDVTSLTELEQAAIRADKMNLLEHVVGCAAHDFSNYLTATAMNLDLARDQLPPEQREAIQGRLDAANRACDAAMELSRELLTFARRETRTRERLDLNAVLRTHEGLFRALLPGATRLTLELDDGPLWIEASLAEVEQVLTNLLVNAADATNRQGHVSIATRSDRAPSTALGTPSGVPPGHDIVCLTVRDDGQGMDAQTVARAFEPFFTTKGEHGTGLGLASVHGIVRDLGGAVRVDSRPGEGTQFDICLPAAGPPPTADRAERGGPDRAG